MINRAATTGQSVALVTYQANPQLSDSGALLVAPLRTHGLATQAISWDEPGVDWTSFAIVVLRSCWDCHLRPAEFSAWIARLQAQGANLHNPAPLVLWNIDKLYLRDLAGARATVVPTVWLDQDAPADLAAIMREQQWSDAVVKSRVGASVYRAWRVGAAEAAERQAEFATLLAAGGLMVQRFMPQIAAGEWSIIFFAGAFSPA